MEALTLGSIVQNQIQINQSNITTETGTAEIREVQINMGIIGFHLFPRTPAEKAGTFGAIKIFRK